VYRAAAGDRVGGHVVREAADEVRRAPLWAVNPDRVALRRRRLSDSEDPDPSLTLPSPKDREKRLTSSPRRRRCGRRGFLRGGCSS
jgi:hypothetical protein